MPFQKGVVTNPNGRVPLALGGSRNKRTSVAFDKYLEIFGENMDRLREQVASMEGKELADTLLKMADYVFPRQSRVINANFNLDDEKEKVKEGFMIGSKFLEF